MRRAFKHSLARQDFHSYVLTVCAGKPGVTDTRTGHFRAVYGGLALSLPKRRKPYDSPAFLALFASLAGLLARYLEDVQED